MRGPRESITNLDFGFDFAVAEVNDVVSAFAGTPFTTRALGTNQKQKRRPANRLVRIINRGFDRIHGEIRRHVAGLHLDSQDARGFRIDPYGVSVSRSQSLRPDCTIQSEDQRRGESPRSLLTWLGGTFDNVTFVVAQQRAEIALLCLQFHLEVVDQVSCRMAFEHISGAYPIAP